MMKRQPTSWHQSLSLRVLLPLLLVLSAASLSTFIYSERLLERVILDQVRKQAEVFLIGLERQIQSFEDPFNRMQLEQLFQQVILKQDPRYTFSIDEIYLYQRDGEVVAHSDLQPHPPKEMNGKYGAVIRTGNSYLRGPVEDKGHNIHSRSRSTDIIIPITLGGERIAALEAELDITRTRQIIASIDDEFEAIMRTITLFSALATALIITLMLWTQLIRPARAYENMLQQSIQEGEALHRAKDDFLSSMSHELRTPLSTIIGYHQLLLDESDLNERYREMVHDSLLAGQTLQQLVNDLLDMSKIRSGKFELSHHPFDLHKVLLDVSRLMQSYTPEKGVQIDLNIDPEATSLLQQYWIGDEIRISQILFNLLSNAIKFSPAAGSVTLSLQSAEEQSNTNTSHPFEIRITDRGIGMSEEVLSRLFTPFEQADSSTSRRFGGTGLGLYISQQLAQMMGGTIKAESTVGLGSIFTVTLPLQRHSEPLTTEPTASHQASPSSHPLNGTILLAEDTVQLQRLTQMMIEHCGATAEIAIDGVEAVEKGMSGNYSMILMDMQMPKMDGIEATKALRKAGCSTPIIALTANVMPHHRTAFEEAGCNDFLSKPVDPAHLCTVLEQYLKPSTEDENQSATERAEPSSFTIDEAVMQDFWEDLLESRNRLTAAYQQQQWQQLSYAAHAIKGMGGSFGYPEISELAAELEKSALSTNMEQRDHDFQRLEQCLLQNNPLEHP